jgi:RNA 2',3'-cyclic 3'-phosphodiesterase
VRVFLAVPSDAMWVESARGLVERLRASTPRAAWTRPESWHLTLRFLGDGVSGEFVDRFSQAMEPVAMETTPGELLAGPPAVFPLRGRARVLGVGFASAPGLESVSELVRRAEEAAVRLGSPPEERPFHPHVTFARIRESWPGEAVEGYRKEVSAWTFPPWFARSCVLFESRLGPDGAVHTPLHEWTFQGGPRGVRA